MIALTWSIVLERLAYAMITILVATFIIVGNIMVILAIHTYRPLQQVQNFLIQSLAIADISVGVLVMPLKIMSLVQGQWIFGYMVCTLYIVSAMLFCSASVMNLCAIAIDRYLTIRYSTWYLPRRTRCTMYLMLTVVYILSGLIVLPTAIGTSPPTWRSMNSTLNICETGYELWYVTYTTVGGFCVPAMLIILVYISLFNTARERWNRTTRSFQEVQKNSTIFASNNGKGIWVQDISSKRRFTTGSLRTFGKNTSAIDQARVLFEEANRRNISMLSSSRKRITNDLVISQNAEDCFDALETEMCQTYSDVGLTSQSKSQTELHLK